MVTCELVGEDERIVGQIFEKCRRRLAGKPAGQIARIILDAGAGAGRLQHFKIEHGALFEPLRFEQAARGIELGEALLHFHLDALDRLQKSRARRDIMGIGIDLDEFEVLRLFAGQRIEFGDRFDRIAKEADAPGAVFIVGRKQFDRIAAHPENTARKIAGRALVLQCDEIRDELALVDFLAELHGKSHRRIGLDRAYAIDAGDGGDNDHIVAFEQGARRRMAHPVDLLVDRAFLLDIGVGARHIGFRLIIIIVRDEIFDRVLRKEAFEFAIKLRRERLVRRKNQGRAVGARDHLRHGEGFSRAGDAEQHLVALLAPDALDEFIDGSGLIALGLIFRDKMKSLAPFRFVRTRRPVRRPGLFLPDVRVAALQQFF